VGITDLAGAAAVASSLIFVWPQVARLVRTRDPQGISVVGALWAMAGFTLWSAYGLHEARYPIFVANGQALVGFAIILALRVRLGDPVRAFRAATAAGVVALVLFGVGAPAAIIGAVAIVVSATGYLPQAVVAWRALDVAGVSPTTYWLLALSATLWIVYGLTARDVLVILPNLLILPTATVIGIRASISVRVGADDIGVEAV
jgi:uncharacterized protein with PQ loop repeat